MHVWVARFHAIPGPAKRDLLRGLGGSRRFVNLWIFGDYMVLYDTIIQDDYSQYMGKIENVPNHQLGTIGYYSPL